MMKSSTILILALYVLVMLLTGCAHGTSPIEPCDKEPATPALSGSRILLGLYTFICEPDTGALDVIPQREADLHLNALKFLEPPALVYLTLEGPPQINGNILDVDIGLRNPYLGFDQFTGFDVCGIVFAHGSLTGFNDPDIVMAGEGDTRLLNADGYTRWWNPVEFPHGDTIFSYKDGMLGTPADQADFNCTINGYKYYADGLNKDDHLTTLDPANRGVFSAGKKNIRHYTIDMSGGLVFNYAVDANWKKPHGDPPYNVPDDFPQKANRPEAWNVSITELDNSLYYEADGYAGGGLKILIDVWDHFDAGLNKVHGESLAGLPLTTALTPIGGGEGYSTYEIDLTGEGLTQSGKAHLLLTVQSEALDYGGILPGKPVCAYFKHGFNIRKPLGWARTWGHEMVPIGDECLGVAVGDSGNIYVTGRFNGPVDFDPGPEINEHISYGEDDAFLCKYDSSGILLWARTWGGILWDMGYGVAVDDSGNAYVAGIFSSTVDFDPGPGVEEHTAQSDPSWADLFVSKFNADGDFIWVRTWGGEYYDHCFGVATDGSDGVYVAGSFALTIDFDPGPGTDEHTSSGYHDAFLSKFNSNGDFQWARTWGGNYGCEACMGVATDGSGYVCVTGYFHGSVDFDPGPGIDEHSSHGEEDVFLSKFDSTGVFHWARTWGGEFEGQGGYFKGDEGFAVDVDGSGNIYVTGTFGDTVDFDPGPGVDEHSSEGEIDVFLSKFYAKGVFQWAHTWGDGGTILPADMGKGVAVDSNSNVYATGNFVGTVDFDPGPGIDEHATNGYYRYVFLSKFDSNGFFLWARTWGGTGMGIGEGVATDDTGNAYVAGTFTDTVDFDPGPYVYWRTSNGGRDCFLSKLPPDGNW